MAFMISRSKSAFSESEKENIDRLEEKESARMSGISSELHLKFSLSSKASSQALDKQVVLRRIRQRKSFNKAKSAFEALLGSSEANTAEEHKWLQQGDAFSAP